MSVSPVAPSASRRLFWSFVVVLLLPACAVVWLGWRLLEADRALEASQRSERQEAAVDQVAAALDRLLSTAELDIAANRSVQAITTDDDAVVVKMGSDGVVAEPSHKLLFHPALPRPPGVDPIRIFAGAEELEQRQRDYVGAARAYRHLVDEAELPSVRAGALLRLARVHRLQHQPGEALGVYARLALLTQASVAGLPADLVARRARCALLSELGHTEALVREASAFRDDLLSGRWVLDRGAFDRYLTDSDGWLGIAETPRDEREHLSAAVEWLWSERADGDLPSSGRHVLVVEDVPVALLWQTIDDRLVALVAGPRHQERVWFDAVVNDAASEGLRLAVVAPERPRPDALGAGAAIPPIWRSHVETGLPWNITATGDAAAVQTGQFAGRRMMLLTGLVLLFAIVIGGGYVIARAVTRELAVARLQSDFVSAVSHEFRTPLTSLQEFTELLSDEPEPSAEKRRLFYGAQARATMRLRRLVESLLDFGRMEAGAKPYHFEPTDVARLVSSTVEEFRQQAVAIGFAIDCTVGPDVGLVNVDADALTLAVWNLLDNAAKYSPGSRRIDVQVERMPAAVAIRVRDEGLGIRRDEHRSIFQKFVRGSHSHVHGIKGTGVGLAMVQHVVLAHRGQVTVESAPGRGSTFTIVLPAPVDGLRQTADELALSSWRRGPTPAARGARRPRSRSGPRGVAGGRTPGVQDPRRRR